MHVDVDGFALLHANTMADLLEMVAVCGERNGGGKEDSAECSANDTRYCNNGTDSDGADWQLPWR